MHLPTIDLCETAQHTPAVCRAQRLHYAAANDNDFKTLSDATNKAVQAEDDKLIRAALLMLTDHGVNAAQEAHKAAIEAMRERDEAGFSHWRGVCAKLDGRLARTLAVTSEAS